MKALYISKKITNREDKILDMYLSDIGKEELITAEEEIELAKRIKIGDERALEKLTRANLRFVVSVAKQYQGQGLSLPDLINEGNLGLIKAAQRFDEMRGFKFISYAVWWIRQPILHAIAQQPRIVRLPLNKNGEVNKIHRTTLKLMQLLEREPTEDEIAEALDFPKEKITDAMRISQWSYSFDKHLSDDEDSSTLLDVFHPNTDNSSEADQILNEKELMEAMRSAMEKLPKLEKEVLKRHYGIGCSKMGRQEIATDLGFKTVGRVDHFKTKAFRRLKATRKDLKKYLRE
ncbi:MAG: RNA polymerase sigma factor RpoD/SigA [Candidatus Paceibacterota bacterium]|jgi:RNA polymerase primary sigma factor